MFILTTVLSGDNLSLNREIMPNARVTSPDGYSECGYTKETSDTSTLIAVGTLFSIYSLYTRSFLDKNQ